MGLFCLFIIDFFFPHLFHLLCYSWRGRLISLHSPYSDSKSRYSRTVTSARHVRLYDRQHNFSISPYFWAPMMLICSFGLNDDIFWFDILWSYSGSNFERTRHLVFYSANTFSIRFRKSSVLRIRRARFKDAGKYACIARNIRGEVRKEFFLSGKPSFTHLLSFYSALARHVQFCFSYVMFVIAQS